MSFLHIAVYIYFVLGTEAFCRQYFKFDRSIHSLLIEMSRLIRMSTSYLCHCICLVQHVLIEVLLLWQGCLSVSVCVTVDSCTNYSEIDWLTVVCRLFHFSHTSAHVFCAQCEGVYQPISWNVVSRSLKIMKRLLRQKSLKLFRLSGILEKELLYRLVRHL